MRFSRLVIEADAQQSLSLSMHPRLTVIAGIPPEVRTALGDELLGALGATRSGVHLELVDDKGATSAVFRPAQGAHRVIDPSTGEDKSDELRTPDGRIDLLAWHGLDARRARELLHFGTAGVTADAGQDEHITRLADLDQRELWSAAARVRITEDELQTLTTRIEAEEDDEDISSRIERRHQVHQQADEQAVRFRRLSTMVAIVALGLAVPTWFVDQDSALPLIAIGIISIVLALLYRARVAAAHRAERTALAQAGAQSYLGYMVSQVDELFDGTEQRKRMAAVAEDHRTAAVRWTALAGDVSVEWAMSHHDEIEATAQLRRQLRTLGRVSPGGVEVDDRTVEVAHALVSHLARLRRAGRSDESLPLIVDDPFGDLPEATTIELLELVQRSSGPPQVILLTADPAIVRWARPRALSGDLDLVEPGRAAADRDELAV